MSADLVTLVTDALAAGAAGAAKDTASKAISDSYGLLRDLVRRRISGKDVELEGENAGSKEQVATALREVGVDKELETAALRVLNVTGQSQVAARYNIQVSGNVKGLAQGDGQSVTMNFSDD